jgi:hypothetical protein
MMEESQISTTEEINFDEFYEFIVSFLEKES